jgi:hypothetical protein
MCNGLGWGVCAAGCADDFLAVSGVVVAVAVQVTVFGVTAFEAGFVGHALMPGRVPVFRMMATSLSAAWYPTS